MRGSAGTIRSLPRCVCVAALLALVPPSPLLAGASTEIAVGKWVRVTTGPEVAGDGFAMSAQETRGEVLWDSGRTTTFNVHGQPVRVAKPHATVEGGLQALDESALVLGVPGESHSITVPRDAIVAIDVRRPESKRFQILPVVAALAGGAIGYRAGDSIAGAFCGDDDAGWCDPDATSTARGIGTGIGVLIGTVVGVVIGEVIARQQGGPKWERVPLDRVRPRDPGVSGVLRDAARRSAEESNQAAMRPSTYWLMLAALSAIPR
jgi:hypothetical protein